MAEIEGSPMFEFVRQSNAIEGITRPPSRVEVDAHRTLLALRTLTVDDVVQFVSAVANAPIRARSGMDVRVARHYPPGGGPQIVTRLNALLDAINKRWLSPWEAHVEYETLHPFMDGNGRSGRAIWLWQVGGLNHLPPLHFLHAFYYQTLQNARRFAKPLSTPESAPKGSLAPEETKP